MTNTQNTTLADDADQHAATARSRERAAGRVAQFLLGIPLGLFQLAAVIGFTITDSTIAGGDWLVVGWGLAMSTACAVLSLRIYRSAGARRVAFVLLAAQALFSAVKFIIYRESASVVFLAIIALTIASLGVYHRAMSVSGAVTATT